LRKTDFCVFEVTGGCGPVLLQFQFTVVYTFKQVVFLEGLKVRLKFQKFPALLNYRKNIFLKTVIAQAHA